MLGISVLRRAAPAGAQFERRVHWDDSLFPSPCEQAPQNRRNRALGAARSWGVILQRQLPDRVVQVWQVEVTDPGVAENRDQVDVEDRALFRQR
jgi:hypothetical protein